MTWEDKEQETPAPVEDVNALQRELEEEKTKAAKCLSNWQRAEADLINYKRCSEQEKEEIKQFANTTLLLELLPFLDDLELAFAHIPPELQDENWVKGVQQIERKFKANLDRYGLACIKALGEPFDPRYHEAIRCDKGPDGIVTCVVRNGYVFRDRVIRPAMVVVGNGEE